jgi:PX domain-containing protein kinase-like protein
LWVQSNPIHDWTRKYSQPGRGLALKKLQQYGRQVLEALLFLKSKGVPHGHVHAGNVMLHDEACRLTGHENAFFGLRARNYPLIKCVN